MNTKQHGDISTVEATYITESGGVFNYTAPWPHENFVSLVWESDSEHEEDTVIEFIYFGSHNNRLIYHSINIEERTNHLS